MTDRAPTAAEPACVRNRMAGLRLFVKYSLMRSTVVRATRVALVITPILSVLNHFAEIRDRNLGAAFWAQVALTFCVPFCVSAYSSAMAAMAEHRRR